MSKYITKYMNLKKSKRSTFGAEGVSHKRALACTVGTRIHGLVFLMSNARFSVLILFYPFRSPRSNPMSEAAKCKCYITYVGNNLKNVGNNLRDRKVNQRGVNGSRLKFLAIGKIGLVPKYTPNPRVLGTVWSSYGGATPTQESPRNKKDPTRKQTPKSSARNSKVYSTG